MSGGSYNYLYSRAPDEFVQWASTIEEMAEALEAGGFALCAAKTRAVVKALRDARAGADALAPVWQAQEWLQSGDWGRSSVRQAAVALGEALSPCEHKEMGRRYGLDSEERMGSFDECEDCGFEANFTPKASP